AGVGSTLLAARNLGRSGVGIELYSSFIAEGEARLAQAMPTKRRSTPKGMPTTAARIQRAARLTSGEVLLPGGLALQFAERSRARRAALHGISTRTQADLDRLAQQAPDLL